MATPVSQPNINKVGLSDLYDLRIKTQWVQGYGEPEHEFEQFYREETTDFEDKRYSYISTFGLWPQRSRGDGVTYQSLYQGYDTTITPYTYISGFEVDQESYEDDPTGIMAGQLASAFAQSARDTIETLAVGPFLNAATYTSATAHYCSPWMTGGDGKALIATDHPCLNGGSWSNTPSSAYDLDYAQLMAAKTRMRKMVNSVGLPFPMEPKTLLVGPTAERLAKEILYSEKQPYVNTNTTNVVKEGLTLKIWNRLVESSGAWFVLADKAGSMGNKGTMLTWLWRIRPEFDRDNAWSTGARLYKGRMRCGAGCPDPRGIDGSLATA